MEEGGGKGGGVSNERGGGTVRDLEDVENELDKLSVILSPFRALTS